MPMNFPPSNMPSPGAMAGAGNMPPGAAPGFNLAPPPPPPMANIGAQPAMPAPVSIDPASLGLPPGAVLYEDGSVRVPADFARQYFGANQSGGANPPPPGMPPGFGSGGGMFPDPGAPPGLAPPPPPPPSMNRGSMPGQPPPMATDPAGMAMGGPPPPPEPGMNLSVPGGASIRDGMPMAPPPLEPELGGMGGTSKKPTTPKDRLNSRGKKPPAKGKGR